MMGQCTSMVVEDVILSRDLSSTIYACFSLFECLIPAPAFEEVVLGHRRFRLIKQVQPCLLTDI